MNIKPAITAAIVQLLANNTNVIRQETPSEMFWNSLLGVESNQQRVTRQTEEVVGKAVDGISRVRDRRKSRITVKRIR